jgi:hypothetical protein
LRILRGSARRELSEVRECIGKAELIRILWKRYSARRALSTCVCRHRRKELLEF